jgi:AraC-like DNA-binding protein
MSRFRLERVEHLREAPLRCLLISVDHSAPHWHQDYEVMLCLKGRLRLGVGTAGWDMGAGDVALVNPGDVHSVAVPEAGNLCVVVQFSPRLIADVYGDDRAFRFQLNTAEGHPPRPEAAGRFRRGLADIGLTLQLKPEGYQFSALAGLYRLIADLFELTVYTLGPADPSRPDEFTLTAFQAIDSHVRRHYREGVKMDDLAREVALSPSSVYRTLRAVAGVTLKDLTDHYRVEHAMDLLRSTRNPVGYIALASGFDSETAFYRVFKKLAGLSPAAYRARDDWDGAPGYDIQGYVKYDVHEAVTLLRAYLADPPSGGRS